MAIKNWLHLSMLLLVFILASGAYLITQIPGTETSQIKAEVVSRTSRSGATGNVGVLICKLKDGQSVSVVVPPVATVQTGDTVVLNTYERYLIGPDYSFAGKLVSGE